VKAEGEVSPRGREGVGGGGGGCGWEGGCKGGGRPETA